MKRKTTSLFFVLVMALSISASAFSARTIAVIPDITFNGTEATCTVQITGDRTTDNIAATMKLWQGQTLIATWSGNGTGILSLSKTATVARNKTYKLTVAYTVNGVTKTPISISRAN